MKYYHQSSKNTRCDIKERLLLTGYWSKPAIVDIRRGLTANHIFQWNQSNCTIQELKNEALAAWKQAWKQLLLNAIKNGINRIGGRFISGLINPKLDVFVDVLIRWFTADAPADVAVDAAADAAVTKTV